MDSLRPHDEFLADNPHAIEADLDRKNEALAIQASQRGARQDAAETTTTDSGVVDTPATPGGDTPDATPASFAVPVEHTDAGMAGTTALDTNARAGMPESEADLSLPDAPAEAATGETLAGSHASLTQAASSAPVSVVELTVARDATGDQLITFTSAFTAEASVATAAVVAAPPEGSIAALLSAYELMQVGWEADGAMAGAINSGQSITVEAGAPPYYTSALLPPGSPKWSSTTPGTPAVVTYSFLTSIPFYYGFTDPTFAPLNAAQQTAARAALQMYSNVANITFQEVAGIGSITFGRADLGDGVGGGAWYPNSGYNGISDLTTAGDIWITTRYSAYNNPRPGSWEYSTFIHELGHAIGMKHPGNYNAGGGGTPAPYLPTAEDNQLYTVMSYYGSPYVVNLSPVTPQLYDIATIQYLYGANTSYRSGNDVYTFPLEYTIQTIWDGGGYDTFDLSNFNVAVTVDLMPGIFSSISGTNNVAIAFGATIEAVIGGNMGDTLWAGTSGSTLNGGGGNDTLYGRGGNDVLIGGTGNDNLRGGQGSDTYVVTVGGGADYADFAPHSLTGSGDTVDLQAITWIRTFNELMAITTQVGTDTIINFGGGNTLTLGSVARSSLSAADFIFSVPPNWPPSDIVLTNASVAEGSVDGTVIGTLSVVDPDDTAHTLILANSAGGKFQINGSNLIVSGGLHGTSYDIVARATDAFGNVFDKTLTITITHAAGTTVNGTAGSDVINADTTVGGQSYVTDQNDFIYGHDSNDTLAGLGGNDWLDGGTGADSMSGGKGDDTYVVDNTGDQVIETGSPTYTAPAGYTIAGTADLDNDGDLDVLLVNDAAKSTLFQILQNGVAVSTVSAVYYTNWKVMGLVDINGDGRKDILYQYGNLYQCAELYNGTTWIGSLNASQVVGRTADAITPMPPGNEGTDTVRSSIGYTLGSGVENLTLVDGAGNINGTGNDLDNIIIGNDGNNIIRGGVGADTLTGNAGADIFVFATGERGTTVGKRDFITDFTPGTDKLDLSLLDANSTVAGTQAFRFLGTSSFDGQVAGLRTTYITARNVTQLQGDTNGDGVADFEIELGGNITLTLADFTPGSLLLPMTLTGDGGANTLTGGDLGDTLSGLGGNDALIGNGGNDFLDGGTGADQMAGGQGDDTYVVDDPGDVVNETSAPSYAPAPGYVVVGTADLDGDGDLDLLVVNDAARSTQFQLMQNGAVVSTVNAVYYLNWTVKGLVDVNGDGKKDILYQYGNLYQCAELYNGTIWIGSLGSASVSGRVADAVQSLSGGNEGADTVQSSISYTLGTGIENLTLVDGAGNINGTGNAVNNVIIGNDGNNILRGGAGIDTLTGNAGADIFAFANGDTGAAIGTRDLITDFAPGTDQIDLTGWDANSAVAGTQAFRFLGTSSFDGQAAGLRFSYVAGRDVTEVQGDTNGDGVADFVIDLAGNRTLTLADFTPGSLRLPLNLTGDGGANTLTGGDLGDTLSGLGGNDTLTGNGGNDLLDGGTGADQMAGGEGDDTYVVDDAGDVVNETSAPSYIVPAGYTIVGTADLDNDGDLDVLLVNDAAKSTLFQILQNGVAVSTIAAVYYTNWTVKGLADINGDGRKDILYQYGNLYQCAELYNGTTLIGSMNASQVVGRVADAITPLAGGNAGTDTVQASISYTLGAGIENLTLVTGAGDINGSGNAANNVIIGNDGSNILRGGAGVDTLTGNAGVDTFAFATGDTGAAIGARDIITDFAPGTDQLDLTGLDANSALAGTQAFRFLGTSSFDGQAAGLRYSYNVGRNVTEVQGDTNGDGVADFAIDLVGNRTLALADFTTGSLLLPLTLTGDGNANTLTGGDLGDTLSGLGGNDTLTGNGGNDLLDGGAGADSMTGGKGDDTYVVDDAGDVVTETGSPTYTVPAGYTIVGTADLDNDGDLDVLLVNDAAKSALFQLLQNGVAVSTVSATYYTNWTVKGLADINGDGRKDILYQYGNLYQCAELYNGTTLIGSLGSAQVSGRTADAIIPMPPGNEGDDSVQSSISYTLGSGVENLALITGAGNINGTGNAADNVIIGNDGNNILRGAGGADTLTGEAGGDTFAFATGDTGAALGKRDLITDFAPGTDQIDLTGWDANSAVAGTQAFRFLGTSSFDGQAAGLRYSYNVGRNVTELQGDTSGDGVADFAIDLAGNKTLAISDFTGGSLLLPLTLTGDGNANTLIGGDLGDTLSGLGGSDTLIGNGGPDYLDGGTGADNMAGGKGDDTYIVDDVGDVVTETGTPAYVAPAGYSVVGTHDLDNDGDLDVLIVNDAAKSALFQLVQNGVAVSTVTAVYYTNWTVKGLADINGDGHKDILYQYGNLYQCAELYNGTTLIGSLNASQVIGRTADSITPLPPGNEGTDTVQSSISYVLGTGVENLTLTGTGNINGTGNAADNVIAGNDGDNFLAGGAGRDTFVFAPDFGHDTVVDFTPGQDIIQADRNLWATVADLLADAANNGSGGVVITADAQNSITLNNVTVNQLLQHQSDFQIL